MKRINGFVRWFDSSGDNGILNCFDGGQYYFDSWSLPKTHYLVTGTCKVTGKQKTVKTRHFPGLFLNYKIIQDPICTKLKHLVPVSFELTNNPNDFWGIKIRIEPKLKNEVKAQQVLSSLMSLDYLNQSEKPTDRTIWLPHEEKRFERLIAEILGVPYEV